MKLIVSACAFRVTNRAIAAGIVALMPVLTLSMNPSVYGQDKGAEPANGTAAAVGTTEGVQTAARLRVIWTGANKSIFEPTFLRRELREDPAWKPDAAASELLERAKEDIDSLLKIVDGAPADWQVRVKEEGPDAKVPHWALLSTTARVFFADARRLRARGGEGDAEASVERVLGVINLAKHFEHERLLGAVRTGRQLAAMGMLEAKRLADAGSLSPEARSKLLSKVMTFNSSDPLDMKSALLSEAQIVVDTTKRVCVGPDAANVFIQKFAPRATSDQIAQSGVRNMDAATLHRQVESVLLCYREAVASWDLPAPGAIEAIKAIEQQRQAGDFGGPAVLLQAELSHHRASTYRLVNLIGEAVKSLGGVPGMPRDAPGAAGGSGGGTPGGK